MTLPLIFIAAVVLGIGVGVGYAAGAALGAWAAGILFAVFSAAALYAAIKEIAKGNRAGDGGTGDVLLAVMLILLVVGVWVGYSIRFF